MTIIGWKFQLSDQDQQLIDYYPNYGFSELSNGMQLIGGREFQI